MTAVDERWLDCAFDPDHLTPLTAELILRLHDHAPGRHCLPGIAALAFLSEPAAGDDWE